MAWRKHLPFLAIVIILAVGLQYLPLLYHASKTPADRVYLGGTRFINDYYIITQFIKQGSTARNMAVNLYTNEPHPSSLVHIEYLLMGKFGGLVGLSPFQTYYLFDTISLVFFLVASFWFLSHFLKGGWLKLSFLWSIFWGGIFWPAIGKSGLLLKTYFDFYQPPDLINRLTFEPNKFLGMGIMLILMVLIHRLLEVLRNNERRFPFSLTFAIITLSFALSLIHTISAIVLGLSVVLYLFFLFILRLSLGDKIISIVKTFLPTVLFFLFLALPLVYWTWVFKNNPGWVNLASLEYGYAKEDAAANILPTITGYVFVLGPLIGLSLLGVRYFLKEQKTKGLLVLSFVFVQNFLFFVGYQFFQTSKLRYWQTPYLVILSLVATYGVVVLLQRLKTQSFKFALSLYLFFIILGLPNTVNHLQPELRQFGDGKNPSVWGYPYKDWHQAMVWLEKNTPNDAVVLAMPTAGQILPAVSGRRVLVGNYVLSYKTEEILPEINAFFRQDLSNEEAKDFLRKENISYVFYGFEEKQIANNAYLSKYSDFLITVFDNRSAAVFKVRDQSSNPFQ